MNKIYIQILALLLIVSSVFCDENKQGNADIISILDNYEQKSEWLNYRISIEQWKLYTTGQADSLEFYNGLYRHLIQDEELQKAVRQSKPNLSDEEDLRRFQLVKSSVLSGKIELNPQIESLRDSLSNLNILYRAQFEGEKANNNVLYQIYRTDNKQSRREAAYRAYVSVGAEMQEGLGKLFKLRNQKSKKLGYNNYFGLSLQYQDIKVNKYLSLLQKLDTLSEKKYINILEKVKNKLRITKPEIWDVSYAYKDIYKRIDSYFPVDSQLLFVKKSLKAIGYNLDKLPIYFDLDSREGKSQYAYAFTIKAPHDMRVLANLTPGILSTKTLMHEVGHALHSAYIRQNHSLFSSSMIDGIWAEAMAQTVAAFVNDPKWLKDYAHISEVVVNEYLTAKQELDIIYLRTTLMRLMFEFEAYRNPNQNLNELYWDLFERYLMLPRHDDIYPWASIIHYTTHPVYLHNYLYADMIAAQNKSFLEENYGSPIDNENTRSFLSQNYFRFGAKYDWRELLKRGTDSKLKPEHFITQLGL